MIGGDDGGLWLSYDGGNRWWKGDNLPISQFYHVSVDDKDPYQVYGGLQDNGSWGGPSQTLRATGPVNDDWRFIQGGDGFVCRVDPFDPDVVYSESQGGAINRQNLRTGESRFVGVRSAQEDATGGSLESEHVVLDPRSVDEDDDGLLTGAGGDHTGGGRRPEGNRALEAVEVDTRRRLTRRHPARDGRERAHRLGEGRQDEGLP